MDNFFEPRPLPDGGVELSVDPKRFRDIFCPGVPADAAVTEVEADSHFVMLSSPDVVADVIREAVTASAASMVA